MHHLTGFDEKSEERGARRRWKFRGEHHLHPTNNSKGCGDGCIDEPEEDRGHSAVSESRTRGEYPFDVRSLKFPMILAVNMDHKTSGLFRVVSPVLTGLGIRGWKFEVERGVDE